MNEFCFNLDEINENNHGMIEDKLPPKINFLINLRNNVSVPRSFFISDKFILKIFSDSELIEKINTQLSYINGNDFNSFNIASNNIALLLNSLSFSEDIKSLIREKYLSLSSNNLSEVGGFAKEMISVSKDDFPVSINIIEEDEYLPSFFTRYHVNGVKGILDTIKDLLKDYYSPVVLYYRFKKGSLNDLPAFLVREDIIPEKSGFISNIDIVGGDRNKIVVEGIKGYPYAILKGDNNPDKYVIDRTTGNLIVKEINTKEYVYMYDDIEREIIKKRIKDNSRVLDVNDLVASFKILEDIKNILNQDIIVLFTISRERIFAEEIIILNKKEFKEGVDLAGMYDKDKEEINSSNYEFLNKGEITKGVYGRDFIFKNDLSINKDVIDGKSVFIGSGNLFSYASFLYRSRNWNLVLLKNQDLFKEGEILELRYGKVYRVIDKDESNTIISDNIPEDKNQDNGIKGTRILINLNNDNTSLIHESESIFLNSESFIKDNSIFSDSPGFEIKNVLENIVSLNKEVFFVLGNNDNIFLKNVEYLIDYHIKGFNNLIPLLSGFIDSKQIKKMLSYMNSKGYDVINKPLGVYIDLPLQTYMVKDLMKAGIRYVFFDIDKLVKRMSGIELKESKVFEKYIEDVLRVFKRQDFEMYNVAEKYDLVSLVDISVLNHAKGIAYPKDLKILGSLIQKSEKKLYLHLLKRKYMIH